MNIFMRNIFFGYLYVDKKYKCRRHTNKSQFLIMIGKDRLLHETVMQTGITCKKSLSIFVTQLAGGVF